MHVNQRMVWNGYFLLLSNQILLIIIPFPAWFWGALSIALKKIIVWKILQRGKDSLYYEDVIAMYRGGGPGSIMSGWFLFNLEKRGRIFCRQNWAVFQQC